jgi:hypothetical protein
LDGIEFGRHGVCQSLPKRIWEEDTTQARGIFFLFLLKPCRVSWFKSPKAWFAVAADRMKVVGLADDDMIINSPNGHY